MEQEKRGVQERRTLTRDSRGSVNISRDMVLALIIILLAAGVIFLVYMRLVVLGTDEADVTVCRTTLLAQMNTQTSLIDSPLHSSCPRRFLYVFADHVINDQPGRLARTVSLWLPSPTDSKTLVKRSSYTALDDATTAAIFAESMRSCWKKGLEGKQQIFNDRGFLFSRSTVCMICDDIQIQTTPKTQTAATYLTDYLRTIAMPGDPTQQTYANYLFTPLERQNSDTVKDPYSKLLPSSASTIGESGPVTCLSRNYIDLDPEISQGGYITVFFRDFSWSNDGCMATYVVPQARVRSLCEYIAN